MTNGQKVIGWGVAIVAIVGFIGLLSTIELPEPPETYYPAPANYVVDDAGVLSQETVDTLNASLKAWDDKENGQIAVAVVKTTNGLSIESYSINLAEKWKVGYAGLDNGVLIVLATEDRQVRLEVGYGNTGVITNAVAGRLLDEYMIPHLKENDWDAGVIAIVEAVQQKLSE